MGYSLGLGSMQRAAAVLEQGAARLQSGQFDAFLLDWLVPPHGQPDLVRAMRAFFDHADDQYQDLIALLSALSVRVDAAGSAYRDADERTAEFLDRMTLRAAT